MLLQSPFNCMVLGSLLAAASASYIPARASLNLRKRWDHNVCTDQLSGVPAPDNTNFNFPLENYRQSQCYDLCIGDQALCTTKTQICYDFVDYNLVFYYKAAGTGYTYSKLNIWLGLSAPSGSPSPQFTSDNGACTIATDGSTAQCTIPWSQITTNSNVLAGMCPWGDQQALSLYLNTAASLNGPNGVVPAEGRLSCTDYPTCSAPYPFTYWVLGYRCTKCATVTPPPVTEYCSFGTAFGFSASNPTSLTLNSVPSPPNTCKRWGWYETPTIAQLTAGIGGPLHVGAGQNDISKAVAVGTWSATLSSGKVSVTYTLSGSYSVAQVHVNIGCLPYQKCAPGQYTYVNEGFTASPAVTTFTTPGLSLPSCSTGLFLMIHASINTSTTMPASDANTFTCPAPVAT